MIKNTRQPLKPKPRVYQIKMQGKLDESWSAWFDGLTVTFESRNDGSSITILTGPVVDQAALRGILFRIWDLNLTLISVTQIETDLDT